jgi:hypothetical protein
MCKSCAAAQLGIFKWALFKSLGCSLDSQATLSTLAWKRHESNIKVHQLFRDSRAKVGQRTGGKGKNLRTAYVVYLTTDAPPLSDGTPQEVRVWSVNKQRAGNAADQINR